MDEEVGFSQTVVVNVSNPAYNVSETTQVINAGNPSSTITAALTTSSNWTIDITHASDSTLLRSFSGTGTAVSAIWDGKASDGTDVPSGTYKYNIKANGTSYASGMVCVWRLTGAPAALIVEGYDFPYNAPEMDEVAKQCLKRGFDVITLPKEISTWANFLSAFNTYPIQAMFITSHGEYEIRHSEDCNPLGIPQITGFMLKDSMAYSYRPQRNDGTYFEEYPAPGDRAYADLNTLFHEPPYVRFAELKAHYISEIPDNRRANMTLVWMDTCYCGRIGAGHGDLASRTNPYNIVGINDMASMFHICDNQYTYGACYVGYFEESESDYHYNLMVGVVFGSLGWGYTMDQAVWRDAYNYNNGYLTRLYLPCTESAGPCHIWRTVMPPYHNLRVHGNPYAFRLSPH